MLIKVGGLRGKKGRGWVEGGRGRELGPAEFRASCLNLPQQPEGRIVLVAGGALALASLGRSGRDAVPGSTWCEGGRGRSAGKGPLQGRAGVGEGTWAAEPGSSLSAWAGRRVGGTGGVDSHTVWRRTCWTPSGSQSGRRGWGSWGRGEGQRTAVACKGLLALSEVTETEDWPEWCMRVWGGLGLWALLHTRFCAVGKELWSRRLSVATRIERVSVIPEKTLPSFASGYFWGDVQVMIFTSAMMLQML